MTKTTKLLMLAGLGYLIYKSMPVSARKKDIYQYGRPVSQIPDVSASMTPASDTQTEKELKTSGLDVKRTVEVTENRISGDSSSGSKTMRYNIVKTPSSSKNLKSSEQSGESISFTPSTYTPVSKGFAELAKKRGLM